MTPGLDSLGAAPGWCWSTVERHDTAGTIVAYRVERCRALAALFERHEDAQGIAWLRNHAHELAEQLLAAHARVEDLTRQSDDHMRANGAILTSVNEALNRAGIYCMITFAEAIDQIAAERDAARTECDRLRAEVEILKKYRHDRALNDEQRQAYDDAVATWRRLYDHEVEANRTLLAQNDRDTAARSESETRLVKLEAVLVAARALRQVLPITRVWLREECALVDAIDAAGKDT
jgi:hypothetical protein